jgi:hypothetical protein
VFGFKKAPSWSPFKSGRQHDQFVATVLEVSHAGPMPLEVSEEEGVLVSRTNKELRFGLFNLAQKCSQLDPKHWREAIAAHLSGVRAAASVTNTTVPWDEARTQLKLRLFPTGMPNPGIVTFPISDAFLTVLALDKPGMVATVSEEQADEWGIAREALYQTALDNIWDEGRLTFEPHRAQGALLRIAHGESFFVASHTLMLDRYVIDEPFHGLLVSVPTRNMAIYHEIADSSLAFALTGMIQAGIGMYQAGPGSVSPHLFWVRNGEWKTLTAIEGDRLNFAPTPEFESEVMNDLDPNLPR